ncbi:ribosomal RNA small subunit methyltransferase D [Comamonadaceae bacterium OS-4]|nr:ribosomal RNA small subunit methyltransferase D [Comamonadaceae bacterium OS-4]
MNAKASSKTTSPRGAAGAAKRPARPRAAQSHEIRIIGGLWKRTKLKVADKPGLRPTPDRVRETVFNWLGQDMTGLRCLDAFAGTGALGFEAASRGAKQVTLIEQDTALIDQLKKTQSQLNAGMVLVQRGDGIAAIRQAAPASLDVIFIDPPFDAPLFEPALGACAHALAAGGWVYLESPAAYTDEALSAYGLRVYRHLKAGAVHAHLLQALVAS